MTFKACKTSKFPPKHLKSLHSLFIKPEKRVTQVNMAIILELCRTNKLAEALKNELYNQYVKYWPKIQEIMK